MLEILHRSDDLVVIDKPPDVSLLADRSGEPCLWDALPDALGRKPYLVHRLDKGTSGVLLVALSPAMQSRLTRAFRQRQVRKFYLAWVVGALEVAGTRRIDLPLKKGRKSRYRVAGPRERIVGDARGWHLGTAMAEGGHPSDTRLRRLRGGPGRTLLMLEPRTGRTHQLRVHLSWIGHPILGDSLYGKPRAPEQQAPRLQLHCHRLVLPGIGAFSAAAADRWLPVRAGSG